jgi:hypothetical protein
MIGGEGGGGIGCLEHQDTLSKDQEHQALRSASLHSVPCQFAPTKIRHPGLPYRTLWRWSWERAGWMPVGYAHPRGERP